MSHARTDISHAVTAEQSRANYGRFRNVVGVSVGSKFTQGRREPGSRCVQFFVSRKVPTGELRRPLPRHVFLRTPNGGLDRSERLRTDVIELPNLRVCCGAGSKVARVGGDGTVTLMFRDRLPGSDKVYAITCSHVVSDLHDAHPANTTVVGGNDTCMFIGDIVGATTLAGGVLEYDIGLVEVRHPDSAFDYLSISGRPAPIAGLARPGAIELDDEYECVFAASGDTRARVESLQTTLKGVAVGGASISIGNLIAAKGRAQPGDSGGLLFSGDTAVGILVAQADGDWLFFHPLTDALTHLKADLDIDFEIFA